jgi:hypothetical protein
MNCPQDVHLHSRSTFALCCCQAASTFETCQSRELTFVPQVSFHLHDPNPAVPWDRSKVEAGAMELECEPFDIRSLIEDVLGMFASTTREKGLELAGLVRDGVPETVVGDAGRIRQVLINLLGNAVKVRLM